MTLGLLFTSLMLGVRHGVDWDHIAAIADLSGSAENRRRGIWLSMLYAVGHAIVVFVLGCAAIIAGTQIPDGLDSWMGRVVGLTLVGLGVWVLVELVRHGRDFRLRSRWMLVLDGTFAGLRRVRTRRSSRSIEVEHDHAHDHADGDGGGAAHGAPAAHDHAHREATAADVDVPAPVAAEAVGETESGRSRPDDRHDHRAGHLHAHAHRHRLALPSSASGRYGSGTATGIGMLHGVGVESPTQIAVFVASTSVVGAAAGVGLLLAWVVGLIIANGVLAILAGAGVLQAERNFTVYATIAVIVAMASIVIGGSYLLGIEMLPAIEL